MGPEIPQLCGSQTADSGVSHDVKESTAEFHPPWISLLTAACWPSSKITARETQASPRDPSRQLWDRDSPRGSALIQTILRHEVVMRPSLASKEFI